MQLVDFIMMNDLFSPKEDGLAPKCTGYLTTLLGFGTVKIIK